MRRSTLRRRCVVAAVALTTMTIGSATTAEAGPACENMFGSGWKNHGEHVLGYVAGDGGAAGGAPAHLSSRPGGPAPGASFCLDQAQSPGLHKSELGG